MCYLDCQRQQFLFFSMSSDNSAARLVVDLWPHDHIITTTSHRRVERSALAARVPVEFRINYPRCAFDADGAHWPVPIISGGYCGSDSRHWPSFEQHTTIHPTASQYRVRRSQFLIKWTSYLEQCPSPLYHWYCKIQTFPEIALFNLAFFSPKWTILLRGEHFYFVIIIQLTILCMYVCMHGVIGNVSPYFVMFMQTN